MRKISLSTYVCFWLGAWLLVIVILKLEGFDEEQNEIFHVPHLKQILQTKYNTTSMDPTFFCTSLFFSFANFVGVSSICSWIKESTRLSKCIELLFLVICLLWTLCTTFSPQGSLKLLPWYAQLIWMLLRICWYCALNYWRLGLLLLHELMED